LALVLNRRVTRNDPLALKLKSFTNPSKGGEENGKENLIVSVCCRAVGVGYYGGGG